MAGFPTDRATIDATIGNEMVNLRKAFEAVVKTNTWLGKRTDAELMAQPLNYTATEIEHIRGAYAALTKLDAVRRGKDEVTAKDDFSFHAEFLTGLN